MEHGCEQGRSLLAARDKAIDATKGIVVGKILGTPETSEERDRNLEYANAVLQVQNPANLYNEHLITCDICHNDRPRSAYSIPLPTA